MRSIFLAFFFLILAPGTHAQIFSDVPEDHFAQKEIADLYQRNIISGYENGTFKPLKLVNRAETLKMLVSALVEKSLYEHNSGITPFSDVSNDSWYSPYVAYALLSGIIDGPPSKIKFYGEKPIILAEFLKILFQIDQQSIGRYVNEEKIIAEDVDDYQQWFYPYIAHGVSTAMIYPTIDTGLHPGKELSRGDVALYLYRYLQYREKKHIASARKLFDKNIEDFQVEYAILPDSDFCEEYSFRAILLAMGMRDTDPQSVEFIALQKTAWAYGKLFKRDNEASRALFDEVKNIAPDIYERYKIDF